LSKSSLEITCIPLVLGSRKTPAHFSISSTCISPLSLLLQTPPTYVRGRVISPGTSVPEVPYARPLPPALTPPFPSPATPALHRALHHHHLPPRISGCGLPAGYVRVRRCVTLTRCTLYQESRPQVEACSRCCDRPGNMLDMFLAHSRLPALRSIFNPPAPTRMYLVEFTRLDPNCVAAGGAFRAEVFADW